MFCKTGSLSSMIVMMTCGHCPLKLVAFINNIIFHYYIVAIYHWAEVNLNFFLLLWILFLNDYQLKMPHTGFCWTTGLKIFYSCTVFNKLQLKKSVLNQIVSFLSNWLFENSKHVISTPNAKVILLDIFHITVVAHRLCWIQFKSWYNFEFTFYCFHWISMMTK